MLAGANFASSPKRIMIDFIDPLIVAERIAMTEKVQGKPMSFEKKVALAHCFENQNDRIKAMEATNPAQIGRQFAF